MSLLGSPARRRRGLVLAETLQGRRHRLARPGKARSGQVARSNGQIWLSQAGAAVTSGQFVAVSIGVGLVSRRHPAA